MKTITSFSIRMSVALLACTFVAGGLLVGSNSFADTTATTSANASVTVPSACTLSGGGNSYSAEIPGGTTKEFGGVTGETDYPGTPIKATCNDPNGYALYAIGYSGHNYTTPTNNQLIASTVGSSNNVNTATSGSNSYWAFKLAPVAGTYAPTIISPYTGYANVPATYAKVAQFPSATDLGSSATGSAIKAYYEVHIASNQAPDTYTGAVKYTLVHPSTNIPNEERSCTAGKICYWPNAGNQVTDSMGDQTVNSSAASADLWASNFQRPGYGFAGWSDKFDWDLNANDANGNGTGVNAGYHIYGPNAAINDADALADIQSNGLSLYAVWVQSAGNLQSWNGCSAMNIGEVTALTDRRDNDTYAVAKLADGNCWMIENLRLDNTNVDNSTGDLAQGYATSSTYGNFIGLAIPETTFSVTEGPTGAAAPNSLYYAGTQSGTASIDIGQINYASYRMPRYGNFNTSSPVANMTNNTQASYSEGNYYTWSSAMANIRYYSGPTATDEDGKTSDNVGTSICPSGWKLPRGRSINSDASAGSFAYLDVQLDGTGENQSGDAGFSRVKKWLSYPNNFVYSGGVQNSSVFNRGSSGYYWSSTAGANVNSYRLFLSRYNFEPGTSNVNKYHAYAVRCLTTHTVQ